MREREALVFFVSDFCRKEKEMTEETKLYTIDEFLGMCKTIYDRAFEETIRGVAAIFLRDMPEFVASTAFELIVREALADTGPDIDKYLEKWKLHITQGNPNIDTSRPCILESDLVETLVAFKLITERKLREYANLLVGGDL